LEKEEEREMIAKKENYLDDQQEHKCFLKRRNELGGRF